MSATVSPYGATTDYTYVNYTSSASPGTVTATTNSHWTKQTLDGLGRTIRSESGDTTNGTTSVVDTQYVACGCSPLGKVGAVSRPHTPTGTVYWTTYHYDWQGRTTSVVLPDNSTTTYVYDDRGTSEAAASYVRITDRRASRSGSRWMASGIWRR